ncbi:MAG: class I SAM-dependent methyltransferase [Anaerolineae bacterium]|nr:class I SAM-dependent methyltransferase [Anaerolineae bacterium]
MSRKTEETYAHLTRLVLDRYRNNARKSLLDVYHNDPDFTLLDHNTLEESFINREEILKVLNDPPLLTNLVNLFVEASIHFTYQNNQFINLDLNEHTILEDLYRNYLLDYKKVLETCLTPDQLESGLNHWIRQHFKDLSVNISRFFDDDRRDTNNVILKQVVCSQYSAQLQMDLLGLKPQELLEPVLDLGCGQSGQLVTHLRSLGLRATGFDRQVDPLEYLLAADWFDIQFKVAQWGCIISHMAFSNHFLFHHYYKNGQPEKYARFFMQLLSALKPGGSFYYTPGLPFIERFLPGEQYQITRRPLQAAAFNLPEFKPLYEENVWYACRILKK